MAFVVHDAVLVSTDVGLDGYFEIVNSTLGRQ